MLKTDLKRSMLAKDSARSTLLKSLISDIQYSEKTTNGSSTSTNNITDVLFKAIKKRQDAIEQFLSANRQDLADKEKNELSIIKSYLPKQLTEDELIEKIKKVVLDIKASGPKDMGKVMKVLKSVVDPGSASPSTMAKNASKFLRDLEK